MVLEFSLIQGNYGANGITYDQESSKEYVKYFNIKSQKLPRLKLIYI